MTTTFKETQRFSQIILWLILFAVGALMSRNFYVQIILGHPVGNKPAPDGVLIVMTLMIYLIILFFVFARLKTRMDDSGIGISFFPFINKTYQWNDIESLRVVDYGFVGGWGMRYSSKYGKIYNMNGSKGLAIVLKNGKKFLVGSQRPDELEEKVMKIMAEHRGGF